MPLPRVAAAALLFSVALYATGLLAQSESAEELGPSGQPVPVPSVKLIGPDEADSGFIRRFFGRIAARETVDLSFEVGGRLVRLPVVEGESYPEGTIVAELEKDNFERAVARAELNLRQATRDQERATRLAESNAASAVRAEDAITARELAEVALSDARDALENSVLRTPFDALVAARLAANFSNVEPGRPILRLHDMSEIRVQIDVPERLFQSGIPPEAITFTGEVAQRNEPVALDLIEFEAQTEAIGQTFLVTLRLPDLSIPTLIPGASMTVTATVSADYTPPGRPLPASALLPGADRSARVMIFEPDPDDPDQGTLRTKEVTVISEAGTDLRVEGLDPDAELVAAGLQMLRDGQTVRRYTGLTTGE